MAMKAWSVAMNMRERGNKKKTEKNSTIMLVKQNETQQEYKKLFTH